MYSQSKEVRGQRIVELLTYDDIDSLQLALNLSREINDKRYKEQSLIQLANKYVVEEQSSFALTYRLQLLELYSKEKAIKKMYSLYLSIGDLYQFEALPDKALQYYHGAKILLENDSVAENEISKKLSAAYFMQGSVDSALYYQNQLLDFYQKEKDQNAVVATRREIISILMKAQKFEKALEQNFIIKGLVENRSDPSLLIKVYNNIGYNYNYLENYEEALLYFLEAEKINKRHGYINEPVLFSNIGIVYGNLGQLQNAISYLLKAEKKLNEEKNPEELAHLYHLMATIYLTNGDVYNALAYNVKAGKLAESKKYSDLISKSYLTSAQVYQDLYEYEKALEFYQKHLNVKDSILLEERIAKQDLLQEQNQIERSEKEIKLLLANQEVQDLRITQLELAEEKLKLSADKLKLEAARKANELELLKKEQAIQESEIKNKELAAQQAKQELELAEQKILAQESDRRILELAQKEELAQVELEKNAALEKERKNEISLLTKDKELLTKDKELLTNKQKLDALQLKQEASFRNTAYGVGGLLGLMLLMFLGGLINSNRKNKLLGKQKTEIEIQKDELESSRDLIEQERSKSEALLLNILPKETAAELKEAGVAKPRKYNEVSILFTDFSNFTHLVQDLNADELIQELNKYFLAFDEICEQHNIEKIKTIGDSFMCAGGIPIENTTHARDAILAAKEMQNFVKRTNEKRKAQNLPPWEMRTGIHTGPVIAGVVGSKKFAYDIWGDAVNTASRMETACEVGRINISATTYERVKDEFDCTYRGAISAKNKGEIDMYFVNA